MNIITQTVWHGGGTSAPPRRARIGVMSGICGWHAADVVPERAIGDPAGGEKSLFTRDIFSFWVANGTKWHDGPRESICGHRRMR